MKNKRYYFTIIISIILLFVLLFLTTVVTGEAGRLIYSMIWLLAFTIPTMLVFAFVGYIASFFTRNPSELAPNTDNTVETLTENTQIKSRNSKKTILIFSIFITALTYVVMLIDNGPDLGNGLGLLLSPILAIVFIGFPMYFIVLAMRYAREKSNMDSLDKAMFYFLLILFVVFAVKNNIFSSLNSKNMIQNMFTSNNTNGEQKIEKQVGPSDLVIKDIYLNPDRFDMFIINFCNESTNATVKTVAIKIETDQNFSDIAENYPSLQSGECEDARIFTNYLKLEKGGLVKITATLDPRNEISETNKDNNTMTKYVNF